MIIENKELINMKMKHDFTEKINRKGSKDYKWDCQGALVRIPMGCADTDYKCPQPVLDALKERIDMGVLAYGDGSIAEYSDAICRHYKLRHDYVINREHVGFSPGLMVALSIFCDIYTTPGDSVLIQPPVFHNFVSAIEGLGRRVVNNPLVYDDCSQTYSIDFEHFEACVKRQDVKIFVLCNPANPVCKVFTKQELERIVDLCYENNVIIVCDEVHSDFCYEDNKHIPLFAVSDKAKKIGIIITAGGKTFNIHAFYCSFVIIENDRLRGIFNLGMKRRKIDYNMLGCLATTVAYNECQYYVDGIVEYVYDNIMYLREFLATEITGVKVVKPEATYLMWLDFKSWNMTSTQIQKLLTKYSVGLADGSKFGIGGEGFLRMNIACHKDSLVEALNIIKTVYEKEIKKNEFLLKKPRINEFIK